MAAILKVWRPIENPTPRCQSKQIYMQNNSAKFHSDPTTWRSLKLFELKRVAPTKEKEEEEEEELLD